MTYLYLDRMQRGEGEKVSQRKFCNSELTIMNGTIDDSSYIRQKLIQYNMTKVPLEGYLVIESLSLVIKDSEGLVVGGVNGTIIQYWKRCHIDILWVDERYRGSGYGDSLLKKVEEVAAEKGCAIIRLETYSFQAPEFYSKRGYEEFGRIDNHPEGHTQFFFKKILE